MSRRSSSRRTRVVTTLGAYAITVPLFAWGATLLSGVVAPGEGQGYWITVLWITVGVLAVEGAVAQWRYIRGGAR